MRPEVTDKRVDTAPAEIATQTMESASPSRSRRDALLKCLLTVAAVVALGIWGYYWKTTGWLREARSMYEDSRYRTALEFLDRVEYWRPGLPEANLLRGLCVGQLASMTQSARSWQEALAAFQAVPNDNEWSVTARWREADVCMILSRAADAEAALQTALRLDPNCLEAYRGLFHIYRWEDRRQEASEIFWKMYELTEPEERIHLLREWFLIGYSQISLADGLARLKSFLQAQPNDARAAIALGRLYVQEKRLGPAEDLLVQAYQRTPEDPAAREAYAEFLLASGQLEKLPSLFESWPPSELSPTAYRIRGTWYQEAKGDFAAAASDFRRVLEGMPDDWQTMFRLATCLQQLGQSNEAQSVREKAHEIQESTKYEVVKELLDDTTIKLWRPENRFRVGEFYRKIGYPQIARAWYEQALALDPEYPECKAALAQLQ